jgi:hypothetical protein
MQHIFRPSANNKILKIALLLLRFCHLWLADMHATLLLHLYEVIFQQNRQQTIYCIA